MAIGNILAVNSHGQFSSGGSVTCDYPSEDDVRDGVSYDSGGFTGNLTLPAATDVRAGVEYGAEGTEFTGALGAGPILPPTAGTTPAAAAVAAIRARLMERLDLPFALCPVVMNDKYRITTTDSFFVFVRVYGVTNPKDPALDFTDSGAGRLSTPVARRIRVYVYTRHFQDSYGDDTVALLGSDPSAVVTDSDATTAPGQLFAEDLVFNALLNFLPQASDGTPLSLGPLHPLDASEVPQRAEEGDAGLSRSCLDWELVYDLPIDPTDPQLA